MQKSGFVLKSRMSFEQALVQFEEIKMNSNTFEFATEINESAMDLVIEEELEDAKELHEGSASVSSTSSMEEEEKLELEIEAEMALMMAEAKSSSKNADRKLKLRDVVVPFSKNAKSTAEGGVAFSLLTRKKPKILYMDKDSAFVKSVQENKDLELNELKSLKSQTLKLERSQ
eukprot:NODE_797_length_4175_cov_0.242826.p2 type:complete len:173 gc:universal NODE_797_length_4175_cov_0.242826:3072-3590(+)